MNGTEQTSAAQTNGHSQTSAAQTSGDSQISAAQVVDKGQQLWELLRGTAAQALVKAYAPYSDYPVGAAALVDDGRVVSGANVENASFGLTLCAECSLISALTMSGGGRLVAFCCLDKFGGVIMPCGRCRQLLWEHGGAELLILTPNGERTMTAVLPQAWGLGQEADEAETDPVAALQPGDEPARGRPRPVASQQAGPRHRSPTART